MMAHQLPLQNLACRCPSINESIVPSDSIFLKQNGQLLHHLAWSGPLKNASSVCHLGNLILGAGWKAKSKFLVLSVSQGTGKFKKKSSELFNEDKSIDVGLSGVINKENDSDLRYIESLDYSEQEILNCNLSSEGHGVADARTFHGNLLNKLKAVQLHLLASEQWNASRIKMCYRNYLLSARNLIHYLALDSLSIQQLKEDLSAFSLLNLESVNQNVLSSIIAWIHLLQNLEATTMNCKDKSDVRSFAVEQKEEFTMVAMQNKASLHVKSLLGTLLAGRPNHIMVTVGKEAIQTDTHIPELINAGANVFRINCAHDNPSVWSAIIKTVKTSCQMLEKSCRILMDLAGPKLRTGCLKPGPNVMRISARKDPKGEVIFPAEVWLSYAGSGPPPAHLRPDAIVLLGDHMQLANLEAGDVVRFSDFRGRRRTLKISQKFQIFKGFGFIAECLRTSYIESGTEFYAKVKKKKVSLGRVVNVPPIEQAIRLRIGDLLVISRDPCLDESSASQIVAPRITCSSSLLFDSVKPGEPIAFDDGKIWGVIQAACMSEIIVSITHTSPKGSKLGSEKSINIPKSVMKFEGLTSKDLIDLDFVAANADMVGISFVRDVRDVEILQRELEKRKLQKLGIVLKIETRSGYEKLPLLLLQAMQLPNPIGVMIARGDLAVECGWDELPMLQEEILSVCSAAHVPVIWATQVLESLVKSGLPTRAEVSDVASGSRANCIMLNKGKYVVEAVSTLDSILRNRSAKKMKAEVKPLALSTNIC